MPTVELEIMFQFAYAIKDILETHSQVATDQQQHLQDQKLLIHADQVHVELMQNAEKEMEQPPVHVYLDSMVIHMWNVNQNVPSIQNVPSTKHVLIKSVSILVQEFVELMHLVQFKTTILPAHVILGTLETHLDIALELRHVSQKLYVCKSILSLNF